MGIRMNRSTTPKKQVEQGGANTPLHPCSTTPPPKGGEGGGGAAGGAPEAVEQTDLSQQQKLIRKGSSHG